LHGLPDIEKGHRGTYLGSISIQQLIILITGLQPKAKSNAATFFAILTVHTPESCDADHSHSIEIFDRGDILEYLPNMPQIVGSA
jgi:hypothetical protein